jgi:hypothetical protein
MTAAGSSYPLSSSRVPANSVTLCTLCKVTARDYLQAVTPQRENLLSLDCNYTAKTKYGRFLKKLEVRGASKILQILLEFFQEIIFPDFSLEFSVKRGQLVHLKLAY